MDVPDEGVLDVDILADEGSEDEGEAPPSSGPASTPTSCASSPRGEEPASPHGALAQISFFHHQPYSRPFFTSTRRGPGRPRKEGVKLAREGKIVRRYRSTPGSVRGAKRHRSSRDDVLDDLLDDEDFVMPVSEEPPYFPEKWPGKLCALCNLGERSQLGQGEMRQINCNIPEGESTVSAVSRSGGTTPTSIMTPTSTPSTPMLPGLSSPPPELIDPQLHPLAMPVSRRQKGINKCKTPYYNLEHTDELSIIGHIEALEITAVVCNSTFYIHRCCLEFSPPFHDQVTSGSSEDDKETLEESRIKGIVIAALFRKCAFCTRHGASIPCNFSCSKYFHLPCVLASGGFQDFQTKSSFCKDHIYQVTLVCSADIDCRTCHVVGDIANLMTCVICGAHYHGTCVGLAQLPGVRAGWACRSCRVCQVCRLDVAPGMSPAESRAVTCEHCDKQYHATCLRPMMATVPKYGWKCKCCRVCSDCGARSPGAGPSSRWHAHYTVCDSCYQQRNKGSCCPLCRRAYRAAAQRDMIRCTLCKRYVHGMCDPDAEPQQYKLKKEQNPTYEYVCPICKPNLQLAAIKSTSFEDEGTQTPSRDSSFSEDILQEQDPLALETKTDIGLGKGKPYTVSSKVAKKKISGYKMKGGFVAAGKLGFQKRQRSSFLDFGRKRGAKPKMRGVFGVPGLGLQRPQAPDNKTSEDDPGVENKLVLCSSKDKFVLTQDLCVMCGAIGTDSEGCLIACSQCGQTYHPYCVSIKVSKVIVTLGWRCLDCTVCEGCGQRGDDALLVLCDDCDTAWHTYCARPQLTEVPRGSWRCERCRRCQTCGTVDTNVWNESYTECGPCASLVMCCICSEPYSDGELIIQCEPCNRWLHATCDNIRTENDAEICCQAGYQCLLCRGRDVPPPHLAKAIESAPTPAVRVPPPAPQSFCLGREYYVDDVCLSQYGASYMKDLETRLGITHTRRKRRFKNEHPDKDAVVQNTDTDLGNDDSKPDSTAEIKDEAGILPNPNYKEGTVWNVATDGPPPEGFTLYTTESGRTVLRRKRQRNLNKLGIGGFVVRQRQATLRAQADDEKDGDAAQPSGESPSNKRKPRRKPRSKLMEQFPSYMQEAFFGKDLLEPTKSAVTSTANPLESPGGCSSLRPVTPEGLRELRDFKVDLDNSDSDGEDVIAALTPFDDNDTSVLINLKEDEIDLLNSLKPKEDREDQGNGSTHMDGTLRIKTEIGHEEVQLKHTEDSTALKNAILGSAQGESSFENTSQSESIPTVHTTKSEPIGSETGGSSAASTISPKDELSLLGVSLDAMVRDSLPDMDGADVDEIFKGVLTDDSQESQESSVSYVNSMAGTPYSQQRHQLASPMEYTSPYHTEYGSGSNSQLSPAFSESGGGSSGGGGSGSGQWPSAETSTPAPPPTYNQRSTDKMRTDETLGTKATISAVLYANTNHPEWKTEFPVWVDRCKQILKKWRALPGEQKAPYLQRARDNRSEIRMKKAQQSSSVGATTGVIAAAGGASAGGAPGEEGDGAASSTANTATATATVINASERPSGTVAGSNVAAVAGSNAGVTSGGVNVPVRAPNVTVTAGGLLEADAHIRVLTPSEIMRTLPPLHNTRDSVPEQERACSQQRSAREAEQERQWKQLQQLRQQQTQQQQQIIHDQRVQAAMQRMRTVDGNGDVTGPEGGAPRSTFPAQRFPLHYSNNEDINRQLRDLLQRHPDKMWAPQSQSEDGLPVVNIEGQPFRQPLPVGARPRPPLLLGQRTDQHLLLQQRLAIEQRGLVSGTGQVSQHLSTGQKITDPNQINASGDEDKSNVNIGPSDATGEEMELGDMDKLEQDPGNIAEVDILTGLGGDDDEELLESLTAEIGEEFNILSYADPELSSFNDAEHILDGLELADEPVERHAKREPEDEGELKSDNKMDSELQKAVKNIENSATDQSKTQVKSEADDTKVEGQETKTIETLQTGNVVRHIYTENGVQRVITQNQITMQGAMQTMKTEVKLEGEDGKTGEGEWRGVQCSPQRAVFNQTFAQQGLVSTQMPLQSMVQRPTQFLSGGPQVMGQQLIQRPQVQFASSQHPMHFQGAGNAGIVTQGMVAGQVRRTRLIAPELHTRPPNVGVGGVTRPPPPPPYPGTLRQPQPPPPPYPQVPFEGAEPWADWLHRRPLLLQKTYVTQPATQSMVAGPVNKRDEKANFNRQNVNQEQPLLLEELLEQEKREQERDGGAEWVGGVGVGAAVGVAVSATVGANVPAPAPPVVPLYAGVPPTAPPPPPDRIVTDADRHAQLLYEQWLQQYNAFATDQLRYYDAEVQKLRKIRKSLNSKQRQLRKSGNELTPTDAAELRRVSTEQAALQKHLEAARKQARQHSMLLQEYETKHRQQNPQIGQQQSTMNQQQISNNQTVFTQNQAMSSQLQQQNTITRPLQIGLQNPVVQQQQTLVRAQQTVLNADGQQTITAQGRTLGTIVTSPMQGQSRILQSGRTLVIEQTGTPQPQLVRQLSGIAQERSTVGGMIPQYGQQQIGGVRNTISTANASARPQGARPAMSPLHVQSPHSQSPLHSLAPQSPLHHLTSPMQSPLHSQQSPLHHTSQSPLHPSTQSPLHTQQSPLHSQQSPMHVQQTPSLSQQSPMHPQQSPLHPQQSPMHPQHSPMHPQHSPMHPQQSSHPQQGQISAQQSAMHTQMPVHSQQSPLHLQQSPMHTQQSPMQSSMSPQHFLQQLQAQRTSPQLPTPSRSPQIYQQSQILSPAASHSPQMQNADYSNARFSRPAPGCSPLPTRFARPPHQQGMRVGVTQFGTRQTSPLGSPQPLQSPGNSSNDTITRQQMLQRQQYSPMGGAPASPMSRSPHVARTPTPSASPAASPAPNSLEHGGGHHGHHVAPIPPGYRYFKPGLFGGAPVWPNKHDDDNRRRTPHISKVSILKRHTPPRSRFTGKTAAPTASDNDRITDDIMNSPHASPNEPREFVLYSSNSVEYTTVTDDTTRMTFGSKDDDDDDMEEIVEEHLDDADIVVVEPGAISPEERIATEQDFEELIDGGKPEDESAEENILTIEKATTRTETTTKTVAVISLGTAKQNVSSVQQYKIVNPSQSTSLSRLPVLSATMLTPHSNTKILNEVSQATVASVSIANQTISVPVLKNLSVPIGNVGGHSGPGSKTHVKKLPLSISNPPLSINMTSPALSKPMSSVISVISSNMNVPKVATLSPVITLATSNTPASSRVPMSILTQQVKQKIVKTIEKPMALSLPNSKLSGLSVNHDVTLPAKIFQDEVASPDSTVISESNQDQKSNLSSREGIEFHSINQIIGSNIKDQRKEIDIESEISQHTELPHSYMSDRTPLLLGKTDIKSPDPIPEKMPDNIMEGDDDDRSDDNMQINPMETLNKSDSDPNTDSVQNDDLAKKENNIVKTIKAIANQNKDMVIDSNLQISSEVTQESVQISIPSPTPSQEQYLNTITMQEHGETEGTQKRVDTIEDMLCMLDNIPNESKVYGAKQILKNFPKGGSSGLQNFNVNVPNTKTDTKDKQEQIPAFLKNRDSDRLNLQSATIPQLSPLSQPTELTTNMANVSQQLRTIMSSINTSKVDSSNVSTAMRKNCETAPTQVNFENLLPSSKVEVAGPRPSPVQRQIEKQPSMHSNSDNVPINAAQAFGSRINTLSLSQSRKSPNISPINSPVGLQPSLIKSPARSPLIINSGNNTNSDDISHPTSISSQIIQMPALSKIQGTLPSTTGTNSIIHTNSSISTSVCSFQKSQVIPTSILGSTLLQPARQLNPNTISYNSQSISSSQPPALVMTSRSTAGAKVESAPNVTVRSHNIVNTSINQGQISKQGSSINFITSSTLLHSQLMSPLKRSKSTDEPKSEIIVGHIQPTKRHSVESVIVKSEPMETDESNNSSNSEPSGNKSSTFQSNSRHDESQNVLLKQLLQTSTTSTNVVPSRPMAIPRAAPALGTIPSLEAQLARPSIPPPTLALSQEIELPKNSPRQIPSRDSPFNQRSIQTSIPTSSMSPSLVQSTAQSLMDVRKQAVKIMNKEETVPLPESSPTVKSIPVYSTNIDQSQHQTTVKKEVAPPQQSPIHRPFTPMDVKKELLDESSQQSATSGVSTASDQGKLDHQIKEDFPESVNMDGNSETVTPETPSEAKKRKRREYQQKKRKQMQLNMKAAAENSINANNAKKRPRKGSRFEEDYDTFIDNLMSQLRLLPPMQIQEPALTTNFAVCPLFGSGDLTKLKNKNYDILKGDLVGEFGNAKIPNVADYYNTKPFGEDEPLPEKPPTSTQRGFYDQEFQPITFDDDPEDKKFDFICKERDTDTPDSIVSCSSPECLEIDPPNRFPGLKLIDDEDEDEDSDSALSGRISPIIPIIAPVPIRIKPVSLYQLKEDDDSQKSLKFIDSDSPLKSKVDSPSSTESNENVTVTLTLTSGAAEDILGVLKELAGILHIPPPTSYQIIERTATPPSHKLGLYRSKGRDGKEGTPIDIQSILNGAAKFCRHCDVVILDSVVRAKASEFPLLSSSKGNGEDILCDSDSELYFCSTQCYKRFAWRPTNIILDGKSKSIIKDDKSDIDNNLSKDRDDFDTASTESMETDDLDIKPDIKDEKMDLSFMDSLDNDELMKEVGDDVSALDEDLKSGDEKTNDSTEKERFRGVRYKAWSPGCIGPPIRYKRPTDRELTELVFRTGVAIMPVTSEDSRKCELCGIQGDGVADGVSRLLNCDVNRWVHLNCALWSDGVYETVSGALMNVETALAAGANATCAACRRLGATVRCFKVRCGSVYHLGCAVKENCVFHKNKTTYCSSHAPKGEKDNELTTLSVQRRVYVSRDEQRQVASVMLHSDTNNLIRVGGLIFLSPGHLLPHQLAAFHTPNYIYPVGYKIVRFYWSMRRANNRCRYVCWISDEDGKPRFHVQPQDENKEEMTAPTARAAWAKVLEAVAALRNGRTEPGVLKLWPDYVTGEDLFGLTEPAVVRVLESLPGIETLTDYRFKFGRSALLEGGLAVNPSGCARCEPRNRATWRRPPRSHVSATPAFGPSASSLEPACPYSKQFVHTKSSQYKKMKMEWRNNVYLARSKIQGLGLYAARDLEKHTMVIEYIGEIIRSELSELREKQYEAKNRGIYMFRLDERRVVDATLSGGLARYINHSCQPNCVAETVEVDRHLRIIIFAKRRIARGEELAYDYKFDIEDDAHKIMCMCGAPNCRKWMN